MSLVKKILREATSYVEVGLFDFDERRWVTQQKEANKLYGRCPVKGIVKNPLYHGTGVNAAKIIQKTGLKSHSFLSADPYFSSRYGEVVFEVTIPKGMKISYGEDKTELQLVENLPPKFLKIYRFADDKR